MWHVIDAYSIKHCIEKMFHIRGRKHPGGIALQKTFLGMKNPSLVSQLILVSLHSPKHLQTVKRVTCSQTCMGE